MQKHVMTFSSFLDKRVAVEHIQEHIEPDGFDECLTEKRIVFFTGVELRPRVILELQRICNPHSYEASDY